MCDVEWNSRETFQNLGWNEYVPWKTKDSKPLNANSVFFTLVKPGVPISTTSSEPATYAILHLGPST